jgi:hypothetical protein
MSNRTSPPKEDHANSKTDHGGARAVRHGTLIRRQEETKGRSIGEVGRPAPSATFHPAAQPGPRPKTRLTEEKKRNRPMKGLNLLHRAQSQPSSSGQRPFSLQPRVERPSTAPAGRPRHPGLANTNNSKGRTERRPLGTGGSTRNPK